MEKNTTAPAPVPARASRNKQIILTILAVLGIVALVGGTMYWLNGRKYVSTDKAQISAPLIQLAPRTPGVLMHISVKEGDALYPGESVARVGGEILSSQISGIAVMVKNDIGAQYSPSSPVVTMIDPNALQVVARIEEDKGLKDIYVGQRVIFTVDAFGSQKFEGTVASVSMTSHEGDVVFNISDKRELQQFDVKIDYDHAKYKELQNGMSAKVWIVK